MKKMLHEISLLFSWRRLCVQPKETRWKKVPAERGSKDSQFQSCKRILRNAHTWGIFERVRQSLAIRKRRNGNVTYILTLEAKEFVHFGRLVSLFFFSASKRSKTGRNPSRLSLECRWIIVDDKRGIFQSRQDLDVQFPGTVGGIAYVT